MLLQFVVMLGAALLMQPQVPVQIPSRPTPTPQPGPAQPASPIAQGVWWWERTEYSNDTTLVASNPSQYTLALLADNRLSVQADCNRVTGTYMLSGSQLTLQLGATTLAACGPDSQDTVFLRDLGQVVTYVFDGQLLHLNMRFDSGNMVFSAQPPASLSRSAWRVQSYNNGRGGVVTVLPETQLSVTFESDSRVSGDTGCNMFNGPYTVAGSTLTFGPLVTTRRACASDAANAQEQAFLAALEATTSYELVGDRLTLRNDAGATQVVLLRPTIQPVPSP